MHLTHASHQWAIRPDDERYDTLDAMHVACAQFRAAAVETPVPLGRTNVIAHQGDVALVGRQSRPVGLTHYAFGQLADTAGAPAAYLRTLPASIAAQALSHGLQGAPDAAGLYRRPVESGDIGRLHAVTSTRYRRIWNADITSRLLDLQARGWRVPPARPCRAGQAGSRQATEADVLSIGGGGGQSVRVGDWIAPAGLYASDHEMFAFMIAERRIDDGTADGLSRGIMIGNSEVGAASLWRMTFLFRHVCGNHIVWGAHEVDEVRLRHVGRVRDRVSAVLEGLSAYADASAHDDEARICAAQRLYLGDDADETVSAAQRRVPDLTAAAARKAYALGSAYADVDGDPRTVWGLAQGLTRLSQDSQYIDGRLGLDRLAGRLLATV